MLPPGCAQHRAGMVLLPAANAREAAQDMFGRQFQFQHKVPGASRISCMALQTLQYTYILPIYQFNELISALSAKIKQVRNRFI